MGGEACGRGKIAGIKKDTREFRGKLRFFFGGGIKTLAGIKKDTREQKGVRYRLELIALDIVCIAAPTLGNFVRIHACTRHINLALRSIGGKCMTS